MRYVSKIVNPSGEIVKSLAIDKAGGYIELSDGGVVFKKDITIPLNALMSIGVSSNEAALVSNSKKTMRAYDFITVRQAQRVTGNEHGHSDCATIFSGTSKCIQRGSDMLIIDTADKLVYVSGYKNSVFITRERYNRNRMRLYNLYDMLGILCRELGSYLFDYSQIWLLSSEPSACILIELSHSKEADLFYTKMYTDVMSVEVHS